MWLNQQTSYRENSQKIFFSILLPSSSDSYNNHKLPRRFIELWKYYFFINAHSALRQWRRRRRRRKKSYNVTFDVKNSKLLHIFNFFQCRSEKKSEERNFNCSWMTVSSSSANKHQDSGQEVVNLLFLITKITLPCNEIICDAFGE